MKRIFLLLSILSLVGRSFTTSWPPLREYIIKRDLFNQKTNQEIGYTVSLKEHGKQYRVHIDATNGRAMNVHVMTHKSKELVAKMIIPDGAIRSLPTFQAAFEIRNETNQNWIIGLVKHHKLDTDARPQYIVEWTGRKIYVFDMDIGLTFNSETEDLLAVISATNSYAFTGGDPALCIHENGYPDLVFLLTWAAITDHSVRIVRNTIAF